MAEMDPFAPVNGQINTLIGTDHMYLMDYNSGDSENEDYGDNQDVNRIYECYIEDCLK